MKILKPIMYITLGTYLFVLLFKWKYANVNTNKVILRSCCFSIVIYLSIPLIAFFVNELKKNTSILRNLMCLINIGLIILSVFVAISYALELISFLPYIIIIIASFFIVTISLIKKI